MRKRKRKGGRERGRGGRSGGKKEGKQVELGVRKKGVPKEWLLWYQKTPCKLPKRKQPTTLLRYDAYEPH